MNRQQFLLQKHFARQCTPAEQKELYHSLLEQPEDYEAVIRELWANPQLQARLSATESSRIYQNIIRRRPAPASRIRSWQAAALLAGLLIGGYLFYALLAPSFTVQQTAFGQTDTLQLPDGSTVVLNSHSEIRYATTWNSEDVREVWLKGEAYFSVQHTMNHQKFLVHTDPLSVEVLGTTFNVNHRPGRTQVVLETGKIKLSTPQQDSLVMQPGDWVELSEASPTLVRKSVNLQDYLSWRKQILVFNQTPLPEVAQIIEDYYGVEVRLQDNLRSRTITGSIPTDNLTVLLRALSASMRIKVHQQDQQIVLSSD